MSGRVGQAIVVRMDLGQGVAAYRFLVDADGTIRVYDDVAHHYTIHTGLRPAQERLVRAAHARAVQS